MFRKYFILNPIWFERFIRSLYIYITLILHWFFRLIYLSNLMQWFDEMPTQRQCIDCTALRETKDVLKSVGNIHANQVIIFQWYFMIKFTTISFRPVYWPKGSNPGHYYSAKRTNTSKEPSYIWEPRNQFSVEWFLFSVRWRASNNACNSGCNLLFHRFSL